MRRMQTGSDRVAWLCGALACAPSFDPDLGIGVAEASRAECRASLSPRDIQGSQARRGFSGQLVEIAGVATLALDTPERTGFFLQSDEPDADPATAEALFVSLTSSAAPPAGTLVRVRGELAGASGQSELVGVERIDECGPVPLEPVSLDAQAIADPAPWQGMWVEAHGSWAVLETATAERDGSLIAAPAGRWYGSGHELGRAAPPELWSIQSAATLRADDARAMPPRLGATLDQIRGVLTADGSARRLYTAGPLAWASSAPPAPERMAESSLRIAALNLDNYLLALDGSGARSAEELGRQRDKLVAALVAIDADVLAFTELENRGTASLAHLLAGLDRALSPDGRYTFSESIPASDTPLRAAIAYRADRVRSRGEAWFDERPGFRRAPLFQSFESAAARFTIGVVHFKSKRCDDGPAIVPGEGCGEAERRAEAELLIEATRAFGTNPAPEPLLVMGDFNSDLLEAPLVALERAGFADLLASVPAADRYSYVFEGRASLLDHALAQYGFAALAERVAVWHINADEPRIRGYSLDNPHEAFAPDPRRSSDHDPVIVDLRP
jgi:predicted extracellular nuclease